MLLEIGLFIKRKTKNKKTETKTKQKPEKKIKITIIITTTIFLLFHFFNFFFLPTWWVEESEICKILWDMTIQCDHIIEATRPDIVVVEKESNKSIIMDIVRHGIKRRVQRLRNAKI